jgi:hypothetical protein
MIGLTSGIPTLWLALLLIWTIPWKGYALWLAARDRSVWWFIVLLIVNTVAILDIIYIFGFGRPAMKKREAASSALAK